MKEPLKKKKISISEHADNVHLTHTDVSYYHLHWYKITFSHAL